MYELLTVIGLLIYGGVFESSHERKESLYKMDGTGRLVFLAVDMLDQMCARYTVQRATRRWTMAMFYGMINISANNMRKDQSEKKIEANTFCFELHMIC